MSKEELKVKAEEMFVPAAMRPMLVDYVFDGTPVGPVLEAIISDRFSPLVRVDNGLLTVEMLNILHAARIVAFFRAVVNEELWGSPEKYLKHIGAKNV